MNNQAPTPDDSETPALWQRVWPVFVGIMIALLLASIGYWAGSRGTQSDEDISASTPMISPVEASSPIGSAIIASQPVASGVIFQGAFSPKAALQAIFGETITKGSASFGRWTQARLPITEEFKNLQGRGSLLVSSIGVYPIQEGGEARQLIVFQSVPDDPQYGAHADGAIIGAAVFRPVDGGWQEVRETRAITVAGAFGQAPNGKPVVLSPTQWGLLFEGGYTGQGETENYAFLVDQNEQGFVVNAQTFDMGHDNSGNCGPESTPCYAYTTTLRFNPTMSGGRYLIDLVKKGTQLGENNTINNVIETQQYRYQGGQYVEDPNKHVVKLKPVVTVPVEPVASPAQ